MHQSHGYQVFSLIFRNVPTVEEMLWRLNPGTISPANELPKTKLPA